MMMKMKIVLIAGFSNPEIRGHLKFKNDSRLYHSLIKLVGLPARVGEFRDYAPWIPSTISFIEQNKEIELHVVGPQIRLQHAMETFQLRGVTYHFYQSEWTSLMRKCNNYRLWKILQRSTHHVRQVVDEVKPDLVVLSGAENPATSIGILATDKYPRLCLCQTIYNNPDRAKYSTPNRLIQDMEKDIFANLQYFGVYSKMHYDLLRRMKPDANIFKFGYPSKGILLKPTPTEKQYDFVNFALMHGSRKGTPDSIQALAIVKQKFPNVTLNIVGGYDEAGLARLKALVKELELENNVSFTPFFEKKSDLLQHVQKARFAVLPCKLDHTAGTMTQSMQLGLPLVVYKTTGTPAFNREKECALIAEKENVEQLAQHMLTLMENPEKSEMLKRNAREYQEKLIEQKKYNGERLVANFISIIENYRKGTPIPQEQLFNPEIEN